MLDNMLDEEQWHGDAGSEVRRCISVLRRAEYTVEQVSRDLHIAEAERETARRDLDVAKRVYFAGQRDKSRIHAPQVTPQKRAWLKELGRHDGFGTAEMRSAAASVGWDPTDGALRGLVSAYRKAGFFMNVGRGFMRFDRHCIAKALGDVFDDEVDRDSQQAGVGVTGDDPSPDTADTTDLPDLSGIPPATARRNDDFDYRDDDYE
ncbi:MAG: hypothetical protein K2W81_02415 [Sphingomonas sp.]|uniref:hypothetical protein n=1 Tax=Sphingomonas sp. TaxID=28214 RepID=UPI0025EF445A|nr:hypothetical protein [Sphingomonas sp.]MBY0282802.1 hypothetical protein [Sphingomonas sp.]